VQVPYDEGVANHIDPESCAAAREGLGEALTGDCVKKARERCAVREMKVGPSEPPCRRRLQTAMSCFGQKPRW
jgi:hypothetical protein